MCVMRIGAETGRALPHKGESPRPSSDGNSLLVDVIVVTYNSRSRVFPCAKAALSAGANVIVVDSASPDRSLEALGDLPVTTIQLSENRGFGFGCNRGWESGSAPYVLFLNPDAVLDEAALGALAAVLDREPAVGAVGPRLLEEDGTLEWSQRRYPRLRSTFARALYLHHLAPQAQWVDEMIRVPAVYEEPGEPDWLSGACLLVRRELLERIGGFDEGFFLYSEDTDLCKRIRDAGYTLRYEPSAVVHHVGGASAPRSGLLHVLASSRVRYMRKHRGVLAGALERTGLVLESLLRLVVSRGGADQRRGHLRTLAALLRGA